MLFPGIPAGSELEKKIDSCVTDIMANHSDVDKSRAIAICKASLNENKELDTDMVEKFIDAGFGPTSFTELGDMRTVQQEAWDIMDLTSDFMFLVDNIMHGPIENKSGTIRQLANDFGSLIDSEVSDLKGRGSFSSRIKNGFKKALGIKSEPLPEPGMFVWKETGDTYKWAARYSNKYRDDDRPSEIVSEKSHEGFVALVDAGVAPLPELWLWHNKDWAIGQAEWVAYDDAGFALAGGYFHPHANEIAKALAVSPVIDRVSHGMPREFIRRDLSDPTIITGHITKEISALPSWAAANKLTGFAVLDESVLKEKSDMAISVQKKRELLNKHGVSADLLDALEKANLGDASMAISEGVQSKETDTESVDVTEADAVEEVEEIEVEEVEEVVETEVDVAEETAASDPVELTGVLTEVVKAVTLLGERMGNIEKEIESLSAKEGTRVAEKARQTPLASLSSLMTSSVVGSDFTRVDGRTSFAKEKPAETKEVAPARYGIPMIDGFIANANVDWQGDINEN